jgi:hypothetical protein
MMELDALGALPLGGIPDVYSILTIEPTGRWLGYIGRTKRPEDMPLEILGLLDDGFDMEEVIALWLMMHNDI